MAWTKGHVTLSFLLNGSGQARDAVYNSLADRAASKGYELPLSLCFHELLDYFVRKQQRYIEIVRGICKRIARVAQAATEKLDLICQSQARGGETLLSSTRQRRRRRTRVSASTSPSWRFRRSILMLKTRRLKRRYRSFGNDCSSYPSSTLRARWALHGSSSLSYSMCAGATLS